MHSLHNALTTNAYSNIILLLGVLASMHIHYESVICIIIISLHTLLE